MRVPKNRCKPGIARLNVSMPGPRRRRAWLAGFVQRLGPQNCHRQLVISLWKNGLVEPEHAIQNAKDEDEAQSARIFRSYVATLAAYQAVDFDDLIRLPVELFRNGDAVRDKWQRRLRYLLVDEYQDTNTCQYELVKLLVTGIGKKPMFTAVGDDDQAIYAWRGATIENLKTLQIDFPDLKVIKLEQNYRSSTRILQAGTR